MSSCPLCEMEATVQWLSSVNELPSCRELVSLTWLVTYSKNKRHPSICFVSTTVYLFESHYKSQGGADSEIGNTQNTKKRTLENGTH